ncbi:12998_t:CDS:2, partial [Funneliformis mosseae]
SIVKVNPFYGKDSEDAQEWIKMFLRVKEANRWLNNRRVAIATGMLREEAADWYNLLMNLKQENKKVETYASRFKKLANRVDAGGIPDAFK